jgi:hypothetical protein
MSLCLVLDDFDVANRYWVLDVAGGAPLKAVKRKPKNAKYIERGFVKRFLIGGPMAIYENDGDVLLAYKGVVKSLCRPDVKIATKSSGFFETVNVAVGDSKETFVQPRIPDAARVWIDPTWDSLDAELCDISAAIMNWYGYAKSLRRR